MPSSSAVVTTAKASSYLQQLCKHWGHRFEVSFDAVQGRIAFGSDEKVLTLAAETDHLKLVLTVPEADGLEKMQNVVAEHLERFAFREELRFDWVAQTA